MKGKIKIAFSIIVDADTNDYPEFVALWEVCEYMNTNEGTFDLIANAVEEGEGDINCTVEEL